MEAAAATSSAAAIERQDRIIQFGPSVAEYSPGLPVAPHRIQVERRGEHRLAGPVGLGHLLAGVAGDERGAIVLDRKLRPILQPAEASLTILHDSPPCLT